jgi:putative oxidoreductase
MFAFLFAQAAPWVLEWGIFILRVGIGVLSVGHGFPKLMGGPSLWRNLGSTMSLVGVSCLPMVWGLLAACAETFGGVAFILGLGTRLACIPLIFAMIVAFLMHRNNGDSFNVYSFSLTLLVVFVAFMFIGSGKLSLDYYLMQ